MYSTVQYSAPFKVPFYSTKMFYIIILGYSEIKSDMIDW